MFRPHHLRRLLRRSLRQLLAGLLPGACLRPGLQRARLRTLGLQGGEMSKSGSRQRGGRHPRRIRRIPGVALRLLRWLAQKTRRQEDFHSGRLS
jgi:hypothetical protein